MFWIFENRLRSSELLRFALREAVAKPAKQNLTTLNAERKTQNPF